MTCYTGEALLCLLDRVLADSVGNVCMWSVRPAVRTPGFESGRLLFKFANTAALTATKGTLLFPPASAVLSPPALPTQEKRSPRSGVVSPKGRPPLRRQGSLGAEDVENVAPHYHASSSPAHGPDPLPPVALSVREPSVEGPTPCIRTQRNVCFDLTSACLVRLLLDLGSRTFK